MSSEQKRPVNEYFRFTLDKSVSDIINKARDDILGPDHGKYIGTDTHVTLFFIGSGRHLTSEERDELREKIVRIPIHIAWKLVGMKRGDVSNVAMLELEFVSDHDQKKLSQSL